MKIIKKRFHEIKSDIKEGDILLFRGNSIVSRFINVYGGGLHSHVALASWHNGGSGILECLEFKEWKGSRATLLETQVKQNDGLIDVFRPSSSYFNLTFNEKTGIIKEEKVEFDGKAVTNCMRRITGLPYGYRRIWWIAQHKLPFLRFFYNISKTIEDENGGELIHPVCSTALSSCFSKCNYDLVKNKHYNWTEPSDISRSNLLNYLFTLTY